MSETPDDLPKLSPLQNTQIQSDTFADTVSVEETIVIHNNKNDIIEIDDAMNVML